MNKELEQFKNENCNNCTKNIDCKIIKNIEGKLVCVEDQLMKDIDYNNCMRRKCEQCKYYDYCFRYQPKNKKVKQNTIKQGDDTI